MMPSLVLNPQGKTDYPRMCWGRRRRDVPVWRVQVEGGEDERLHPHLSERLLQHGKPSGSSRHYTPPTAGPQMD